MNTTSPQLTSTPPDRPTWGEVFDERSSILGAPAFFGPPVIFVVGPWLLLVLLLVGPLALLLTIVLALALGGALLAAFAAVLASPYLLIRELSAHLAAPSKARLPLHFSRKHRVGSSRLGSPQPKGLS